MSLNQRFTNYSNGNNQKSNGQRNQPGPSKARQPAGQKSPRAGMAVSQRPRYIRRPTPYPDRKARMVVNNAPVQNHASLSSTSNTSRAVTNTLKNLSLTAQPQPTSINKTSMHQFATCRVDPFNNKGSMGVPDNDTTPRIVVDYRTYADITFTRAGSAQVTVLPLLPTFAGLGLSSGCSATVVDAFGSRDVVPNPGMSNQQAGGLIPIATPPDLLSYFATAPVSPAAGQPQFVNPIYNASKARVVTLASRLSYTGQAMQCSGVITTSHGQFEAPITDNPMNSEGLNTYNQLTGGPVAVAATNFAAVTKGILTTSGSTYQQETITGRPESGVTSIAKKTNERFEWKPCSHNPYFVAQTASAGNLIPIFAAEVGTNRLGQNFFHDDSWKPTCHTISNIIPGHSYRLELYLCMEFAVENNSPFERFAKIPPSIPSKDLLHIEKVVHQMPLAVPTDKPNAFVSFLRLATKIGLALI